MLKINIRDSHRKILIIKNITNIIELLDVKEQPAGLYIYELDHENKIIALRFIKI